MYVCMYVYMYMSIVVLYSFTNLKFTVYLVIFACLDFREFVILVLFVKWKSRIINFDDGSAIIIKFSRDS